MNRRRRRMSEQPYIRIVKNELISMGYNEAHTRTLLRIYKTLRRNWGFYLNADDFAKEIHETYQAINIKYDPNNLDHIYVGDLRDKIIQRKRGEKRAGSMFFEITQVMSKKIEDWDRCKPVDVSGAKFSYTFIPSDLRTVIFVQCDVCGRKIDLTEYF
jgi:hypothetical protein